MQRLLRSDVQPSRMKSRTWIPLVCGMQRAELDSIATWLQILHRDVP
jgi:hypothetical protein